MTVDNLLIVVVGDRSTIEPDLAELGFEVVHVDEDGNEMARMSDR